MLLWAMESSRILGFEKEAARHIRILTSESPIDIVWIHHDGINVNGVLFSIMLDDNVMSDWVERLYTAYPPHKEMMNFLPSSINTLVLYHIERLYIPQSVQYVAQHLDVFFPTSDHLRLRVNYGLVSVNLDECGLHLVDNIWNVQASIWTQFCSDYSSLMACLHFYQENFRHVSWKYLMFHFKDIMYYGDEFLKEPSLFIPLSKMPIDIPTFMKSYLHHGLEEVDIYY